MDCQHGRGAGAVVSGSFGLFQPINSFNETGSFFDGMQAGYNYMLPNRFVVGAEADASFPSFQNLNGISIGGTSTLLAPAIGAESFSETMLSFGTVRGRIGYAPGNWLFYATGGFAWAYDQLTLTQLGERRDRFAVLVAVWLGRRRRRRGAGGAALDRAARISVHRLRRQQRDVPSGGTAVQLRFFAAGAARGLELSVRQRCAAGQHHRHQGAGCAGPRRRQFPRPDHVRLAGLSGIPLAFCRPQQPARRRRGARDLRRHALCRRAAVARRRAVDQPGDRPGFRPWRIHTASAGFPSGEAYKLGATYPYARVQRYFLRQTIDLGGETEKVDADINQFAGTQTANRLVLTVGKFSVVDIFDTNKYANNPKSDFLNWSLINAGTLRLCRRRLGLTATAPPPNGTRAAGRCAAACSTCR